MSETISNVEAERALIGALMLDAMDYPIAREKIVPDDFFFPALGRGFQGHRQGV
jgi:replicative DNA helicase